MTKHPDWQYRLQRFLVGWQSAPFCYGQCDCCLFVAHALLAMTGTDLGARFRGRYRTHAEALAVCEEHAGSRSVAALVESIFREHGLAEIPALCAQRGDVVLIRRSGSDYSLGIVALNGREILGVGEQGFLRIPLERGSRAWRVKETNK